jgi:hypothetical protein
MLKYFEGCHLRIQFFDFYEMRLFVKKILNLLIEINIFYIGCNLYKNALQWFVDIYFQFLLELFFF